MLCLHFTILNLDNGANNTCPIVFVPVVGLVRIEDDKMKDIVSRMK